MKYTCPHCGAEQSEVSAYYEHYQKIKLTDDGAFVADQETIFDELVDVECPTCSQSIKTFVEENEELLYAIRDAC